MRVRLLNALAAMLILVVTTGCGSVLNSIPASGAVGGLLGAGAGAAIGSAMSNGNIAASALLGAGAGAAAGIVTAVLVQRNDEERQQKEFLRDVQQNQATIFQREREIEILREEVNQDSPHGLPTQVNPNPPYLGPTLGNPYR